MKNQETKKNGKQEETQLLVNAGGCSDKNKNFKLSTESLRYIWGVLVVALITETDKSFLFKYIWVSPQKKKKTF